MYVSGMEGCMVNNGGVSGAKRGLAWGCKFWGVGCKSATKWYSPARLEFTQRVISITDGYCIHLAPNDISTPHYDMRHGLLWRLPRM